MSSRPEDSRPANETTLDAWTATSPEPDADPSASNDADTRPASAPNGSVSNLTAIFHDIVGTYTVTEAQEEAPSHEPVDGSDNGVPDLSEDGLDDAADSDLIMGGWI